MKNPRAWGIAAILSLLCGGAHRLVSETITLTTSYPSPAGIYRSLITTGGDPASPTNTVLSRDTGRVGIGTTAPLGKLDVTSLDSGFLPPRMNTAQRNAIASPASGMMVYNVDSKKVEFFDGTSWEAISDNSEGWVGPPAGAMAGPWGYWYWWPPDGADHSADKICQNAGYRRATGICRTGYTPYYVYGPPWNQLKAYGTVTSVYWPFWGAPSWYLACNWYPWSYYIDASGEILCQH